MKVLPFNKPTWAPFSVLISLGTPTTLEQALRVAAPSHNVETASPADGYGLSIQSRGAWTWLSESEFDPVDCFLTDEVAESIIGLMAVNGAYIAHNPDNGLLAVSIYELGRRRFAWCESDEGGPQYARLFKDSGFAHDDCPIDFAVRWMNLTDAHVIDRYSFVRRLLRSHDINFHPRYLREAPSPSVFFDYCS